MINDVEDYVEFNRYLINLSFSIPNIVLKPAGDNKFNDNKDIVGSKNNIIKN